MNFVHSRKPYFKDFSESMKIIIEMTGLYFVKLEFIVVINFFDSVTISLFIYIHFFFFLNTTPFFHLLLLLLLLLNFNFLLFVWYFVVSLIKKHIFYVFHVHNFIIIFRVIIIITNIIFVLLIIFISYCFFLVYSSCKWLGYYL